ncbi:MAG: hypothetical protein AAF490_00270 [Chloroflexota bacterium]
MKQKDVFWFWLPLFTSWLLMTAEGPIISAAINRLPEEVVMLAAQGIVLTLSVTIQSPMINMLATATALVKDRPSFLIVRNFTLVVLVLLTTITILIGYTPVFEMVVVQWLGTPVEVAEWVRPGMQIMVFWSAAIGWRRFLQGVLIHFNFPKQVAWGTTTRLIAVSSMLLTLIFLTDLPGAIIGAISLITAVSIEALYATWAVRPLFKTVLSKTAPIADGPPLTYWGLFKFHAPLAGSAVLVLLMQPLVTFTISRLDQPTLNLAAWPVIFQIILLARAGALAYPEAVIALSQKENSQAPIRKFAFNMALVLTGLTVLFIFTPAVNFYLFQIQDVTEGVANLVQASMPYFIIFPALNVINFWLRGIFIFERRTTLVNMGMTVNIAITAVILFIGLQFKWPSLPTAAIALNIAMICEIGILAVKYVTTESYEKERLNLSILTK